MGEVMGKARYYMPVVVFQLLDRGIKTAHMID